MKKQLSAVLSCILLLVLTACSQSDSSLKLAVKQIGKPMLTAYKAMGFEDPESHANTTVLFVEDGIELCGQSGIVVLAHSDPYSLLGYKNPLDNPELTNISLSFPFQQLDEEDYAFPLELYNYIVSEFGEPSENKTYASFADMDAQAIADALKRYGEIAANVWNIDHDVQIIMSGMSSGLDSRVPDDTSLYISVYILQKKEDVSF